MLDIGPHNVSCPSARISPSPSPLLPSQALLASHSPSLPSTLTPSSSLFRAKTCIHPSYPASVLARFDPSSFLLSFSFLRLSASSPSVSLGLGSLSLLLAYRCPQVGSQGSVHIFILFIHIYTTLYFEPDSGRSHFELLPNSTTPASSISPTFFLLSPASSSPLHCLHPSSSIVCHSPLLAVRYSSTHPYSTLSARFFLLLTWFEMQLKLTLLPFLASALALVSQQTAAAPSPIGSFVPAGNDTRPVIRADNNGKFLDSLFDQRGELLPNPRIVLESRQSPAFPYGSQKVS